MLFFVWMPLSLSAPRPAVVSRPLSTQLIFSRHSLDTAANGYSKELGIPILPKPEVGMCAPNTTAEKQAGVPNGPWLTLAIAPFAGENVSPEKDLIQRNTMIALARLPRVKLVLFMDGDRYLSLARSLGARVQRRIVSNKHGTPLLRHLMLDTIAMSQGGASGPYTPLIG